MRALVVLSSLLAGAGCGAPSSPDTESGVDADSEGGNGEGTEDALDADRPDHVAPYDVVGCHEPGTSGSIAGLDLAPLGVGEHLGTFTLRTADGSASILEPLMLDLWRDGDSLNGCADLGNLSDVGQTLTPVGRDAFRADFSCWVTRCATGTAWLDAVLHDDDLDGAVDEVSATYGAAIVAPPGPGPWLTFETPVAGGRDTEPPTASFAARSFPAADLFLSFSEPMSPSSVADAGWRVERASGGAVSGTWSVASGFRCGVDSLQFVPDRLWMPGENLRVVTDHPATDVAGNALSVVAAGNTAERPPDAGDNGGLERGDLEGFFAQGFEVRDGFGAITGPFEGRWMMQADYVGRLATVLRVPEGATVFRMRMRFLLPGQMSVEPYFGIEPPQVLLLVEGLPSGRYAAMEVVIPEFLDLSGEIGGPLPIWATDWTTFAFDLGCLEADEILVRLSAHLEIRQSCDVYVAPLVLLLDDLGFDE